MRIVLLLGLTFFSGCVARHTRLPSRATVATEWGEVTLAYDESERRDEALLQESVKKALSRLEAWGGLRAPVKLFVLPSHEALEEAVNRRGYGWLKAWARYDEVFLQAPRTWAPWGARERDVQELLLHELTHCVMYQQSSEKVSWQKTELPFWFKEGMASFTAGQGFRWPSLAQLALHLEARSPEDALKSPHLYVQKQSEVAYGAAHHAFAFLVKRYGQARVRKLLALMRQGSPFPNAFSRAVGLSPLDFETDFRRYVLWRGFLPGRMRLEKPLAPSPPLK
jgi:hypothetical protein